MSDRVRDKIAEYGVDWDEAEMEILEFIDNRYGGAAKDGIMVGDGDNPRISKKMKYYQTVDGETFVRIRLNKMVRMADADKIACRVSIAEETPDLIKVKVMAKNKPARILKVCQVSLI